MKKKMTVIIVLLLASFTFAQNNERNPVERNSFTRLFTSAQAYTWVYQKPKSKGSLYLFDSWKNVGVVEAKDGNKAIVRNINFNVDSQRFESQFLTDSVYQFDFDKLKSVTINNKPFKQINLKDELMTMEVIFESPQLTILKNYMINVYTASYNPMLNRKQDTYTQRASYYLKKGNSIEEINLNKKNVLKILSDLSVSSADAKAFIKENDLSFKKDFDVQLILKHYLKQE